MTLTIGRFSTAEGFYFSEQGDSLNIRGEVRPTSDQVNTMIAARVQLLGLEAGDVIPVTSSDLASLDGFYRVSGTVSVTPLPVTLANGCFDFDISLERVANGFAVPAMETTTVITQRTQSTSVVTAQYATWTPSDQKWPTITVPGTRVAATGTVITPSLTSLSVGITSTQINVIGLAPADYYDGAATIEFLLGSTWWPLQGRQVPAAAADAIRIGNGLIRMTWRTDGDIEVDVYNGSSWGALGDFLWVRSVTTSPSGNAYVTTPPIVLRNTPTQVALRYQLTDTVASPSLASHIVDVTLDRGDFNFAITSPSSILDWRLKAKSATAATALTGGIRQTSNGAAGHRWVMATSGAFSTDLVNGHITNGTATLKSWMLGAEMNGSSATAGLNTAQFIVNQYWMGRGIAERVISP